MSRFPPTVIICDNPSLLASAQELSQQLQIPIQSHLDQSLENYQFALLLDDQGLQLTEIGEKSLGPLKVDFYSGGLSFRRQQDLGKELLAKAIGIRGELQPTVWDVTAGLGQDSAILAAYGCNTFLFERNSIIHALLADGVARAKQLPADEPEAKILLNRMSLHHRDGIDALTVKDLPMPDVVYIDPMFPEKKKNAKAKKGMQYCQQIVGKDVDEKELLSAALDYVGYRVVVKRPKSAPCLNQIKPSNQLLGKTVRYDIYALRSTANYLSGELSEEKNATTR